MNGDTLAVTRTRGLAVLAHNVRVSVERDDKEGTLDAIQELIDAAAAIRTVVRAGRLNESGDFSLVVLACSAAEENR